VRNDVSAKLRVRTQDCKELHIWQKGLSGRGGGGGYLPLRGEKRVPAAHLPAFVWPTNLSGGLLRATFWQLLARSAQGLRQHPRTSHSSRIFRGRLHHALLAARRFAATCPLWCVSLPCSQFDTEPMPLCSAIYRKCGGSGGFCRRSRKKIKRPTITTKTPPIKTSPVGMPCYLSMMLHQEEGARRGNAGMLHDGGVRRPARHGKANLPRVRRGLRPPRVPASTRAENADLSEPRLPSQSWSEIQRQNRREDRRWRRSWAQRPRVARADA